MKEQDGLIEELLAYAKFHLHCDELDLFYLRNRLKEVLNVDIFAKQIDTEWIASMKTPDLLIDKIRKHKINVGEEIDEAAIAGILGMMTPPPSVVAERIRELEEKESESGLEYLYDLCVKNDYIRSSAIEKNRFFSQKLRGKTMEIEINLSKPEKNGRESRKEKQNEYPKCPLCLENIGYSGDGKQPSRANLRVFPIRFDEEEWFVQYSPYSYFSHHLIVISKEHREMVIDARTFRNLLIFTDRFPSYFVGSNADLPIVGGSIPTHRHYQGGTHFLPIFAAKDREVYYRDNRVKISSLEWDCTILKIQGEKSQVLRFSERILEVWKNFDEESIGLLSHTDRKRHNAISPIARKENDGYAMFLILKNNRCDENFPEGIFHAHREYHHVKSEGIGLIESAGLFILPPRLTEVIKLLEEILSDESKKERVYSAYPALRIYDKRIGSRQKKTMVLQPTEIEKQVQKLICESCAEILKNTAVFKDDRDGRRALNRFMQEVLRES